jgi:RNA polymerase sigma-32 factor
MKGQLERLEQRDLSPEAKEWIAFELGVSEEDVVEMNRRMSGADRSLKVTMTDDSESEGLDGLVDEGPNQEILMVTPKRWPNAANCWARRWQASRA